MNVLLISPYELGRQPFALAHPAALLRAAGHKVSLLDLSLSSLPHERLYEFDIIGVSLGMHTATRIALTLLPGVRAQARGAKLVCYGVYGPPNTEALKSVGVDVVLGPEFESALLDLANSEPNSLQAGRKTSFTVPDRSDLPALKRYAHLILPGGERKTVGFAESSRGCKHLCRHCPIVPVYEGTFRAIPRDVVLEDIEQQVASGAAHISFGDPDFLNGPTHALRILDAMHRRWPSLSFDATVKISHILAHADAIPVLREYGCLFLTTAAESFDDAVLEKLDKGHKGEDIARAVAIARDSEIAIAPTFVPFTPWTTLENYLDLLTQLRDLLLINSVPPIQLVIRLLVPSGSYLLRLPGFLESLRPFAGDLLGYPWSSPDPKVDALQAHVQAWVEKADSEGLGRFETFEGLWRLTHESMGLSVPSLDRDMAGPEVPHLSEPWYCCAEPTTAQLARGASAG